MGKKQRPRIDPVADDTPLHNPFTGLAALRDQLPDRPAPPSQPGTAAEPATEPLTRALAARLVIHHERKGHGGKTVTLLRGDALDDSLRAQLAAELRRALGTHAGVEGDAVVLGGDQRARLQAWLQQRGARRIVVSS